MDVTTGLFVKNYQVDISVLADELLTRLHDEERRGTNKVTVVGTGQVGMAAAFAMMTQVAEMCASVLLYVFIVCYLLLIIFIL